MHRCGSGFLFILATVFAAALTGCLGKNSTNNFTGGVTSVSLNPNGNLSLEQGSTQVFTASGKNATGGAVLGVSIQFIVSVPAGTTGSAPLSITANGNACAGTWDTAGAVCNAGTAGVAVVTAVINGISSLPAYVYVHPHVDSIQISQAQSQPPIYPCFSQGQSWMFKATAYSNNTDITNFVGPITWSASNSGVLTATPQVIGEPPTQQFNQVKVTAKAPGITQLFAAVSGATSAPYSYTTCLVQAIHLQIGGQANGGNSITVSTGGSIPITATVVDTLFPYTGLAMPNPPLTWSTSNPEIAAFATTTNTTGSNSATARKNVGGVILTASCSPPTCNIGLPGVTPPYGNPAGTIVPSLPIYASDGQLPNKTQGYGAVSVDVTLASGATAPTYQAWAATTGCQDQVGCTSSLFSLAESKPGANPIATIVTLPRTPNSLLFNRQSSPRLYIGSDQGLMYIDVGGTTLSLTTVSPSSTPCNVSLCGKLLTTSNDGKLAVVSDNVSSPSRVYIYNGGSNSTPPVDLGLLPGETAVGASFSPDQLKLFILTSAGNLYVYSTVDATTSVPLAAPAIDALFSADGSFAYLAGTPAGSVSAYSTCSLPDEGSQPSQASVNLGAVATAIPPFKLFPSPVMRPLQDGDQWITQDILALEVPAPESTNQTTSIQTLTANFTQNPIPYQNPLQFTCNPPVPPNNAPLLTAGAVVSLGQGAFTPLYANLVANGTQMIVVNPNTPSVLIYNVSNSSISSIPLHPIASTPTPLSASASADGSQIFVATCDQYPDNDPNQPCTLGSVHILSNIGGNGSDIQQVPFINTKDQNNNNMCNGLGTNAPLCIPNLVAARPQ
jgi:hypothetical protein